MITVTIFRLKPQILFIFHLTFKFLTLQLVISNKNTTSVKYILKLNIIVTTVVYYYTIEDKLCLYFNKVSTVTQISIHKLNSYT